MSPLERGGTSGGSLEFAPSLDSTVDTPLKSPLGKGGTIREQRASARTPNLFTASLHWRGIEASPRLGLKRVAPAGSCFRPHFHAVSRRLRRHGTLLK